ncbi:MAG: ABC transporter ATP-binding protein [Acidimicrobiia bacterium]|nr:ABC transporter ATP-binding protein [Acidimicrobiia bacterium]
MPAIVARDLSKAFGPSWAVDGLDLEVEHGEVLALLGPNGAGKTTTVRVLNGVLGATRGGALVLGLDPAIDGDELRRHTGVLTENAGLDDRLTARENLLFTATVRGFSKADAQRRVDELLDQFDMRALGDERTVGFSTGQRKRVALVRALLHDPQLLFLDEPTSGLDPAASRDVVALIEQLVHDHGRTVVLCTHFLGEAGRLADRMAFLDHGVLRAFGRPQQLAAELWSTTELRIDLDRPAAPAELAAIRAVDGVGSTNATDNGARAEIRARDRVPAVVAALAAAGADVFGVAAQPPTLEDVYFALETRIADDPDFRLIHPSTPQAAR